MPRCGRNPDIERRQQVVALRRQGLTFAKIAEQLGVTHQAVQQMFTTVAGSGIDLRRRPPLTERQILAWADAHFKRTGRWPAEEDRTIADAPDETWKSVDAAMRRGGRGLPARSSIARLLAKHRGVRNRGALPPLTTKLILSWVDAYHKRTGLWPQVESGPIPEAPDECWKAVNFALREGYRGLPGGSTLARFIKKHRPQATVRIRWRKRKAK